MQDLGAIRRAPGWRPGRLILPCLCLAVLAYFGYHAVYGQRGFLAYLDVSREKAALEQELATLQDRRERLEARVAILRPESLDPDLLDERIRAVLGYAETDEIVIFRDPPQN